MVMVRVRVRFRVRFRVRVRVYIDNGCTAQLVNINELAANRHGPVSEIGYRLGLCLPNGIIVLMLRCTEEDDV